MSPRANAPVLSSAGPRASAAELMAQLHDPRPSVRLRAVKQLAQSSEPEALDGLIVALHDPRFGVHWAASEALAKQGERGTIAVLQALVHDAASVGFLHGAAYALAHAHLAPGQRPAVAPVVDALRRPAADLEAPLLAARALEALGVPGVEPAPGASRHPVTLTVTREMAEALRQTIQRSLNGPRIPDDADLLLGVLAQLH